MTAYNVIGESPTSTPVEVFVGEAGRWKENQLICFYFLTVLTYFNIHQIIFNICPGKELLEKFCGPGH